MTGKLLLEDGAALLGEDEGFLLTEDALTRSQSKRIPVFFTLHLWMSGEGAQILTFTFDTPPISIYPEADEVLMIEELVIANKAAGVVKVFGGTSSTPATPYVFSGNNGANALNFLEFNPAYALPFSRALYVYFSETGLIDVNGKGYLQKV